MDEPLYRLPLTTKPLPHGAAAREDKLREIRQEATASDRIAAYKGLLASQATDPLDDLLERVRKARSASYGQWQRFW